jgi:hypothetical protein
VSPVPEFLPTTPGTQVSIGTDRVMTFIEPDTARQGVIGQGRVDLLERISQLWRGDWSGREFDGKDGHGWIQGALYGDADTLRKLDKELAGVEAAA